MNPENQHLHGMVVFGSGGVSDQEAAERVGEVMSSIEKAADKGGKASAAFLKALEETSNIQVHVTETACVAYSSKFPENSIKINPSVESDARRLTPGGWQVMSDDFAAVLVHEVMHKLPALDFPPNSQGTYKGPQKNTSEWNDPHWSESGIQPDDAGFAQAYYTQEYGASRAAYMARLDPEYPVKLAEGELRAVRGTNAVMSEVREESYYFPRRFYLGADEKAFCSDAEGRRIPSEDQSVPVDTKIYLNRKLEKMQETIFGKEPPKPEGENRPLPQKNHEPIPGVSMLEERSPGQIAADYLLQQASTEVVRPQLAQKIIDAQIALNKAQSGQYSVQAQESFELVSPESGPKIG